MGSRWAILNNNNNKWEPISSDCENQKGEWLCPLSIWNSEFTQYWPIVFTPTNNNIWYMGRGIFY